MSPNLYIYINDNQNYKNSCTQGIKYAHWGRSLQVSQWYLNKINKNKKFQ